jgi:energy-coupling factor transporter ATP-binding protein EcfA2
VIQLRHVCFTYRDATEPALRDVTLGVGRGELVVVMGATGAGKTTLAKCLNRIIPAFQPGELTGEIEIAGRVLRDDGVADLAGVVGLVSQDFEAQLFATSVRDEVAFAMEQRGMSRETMLERLQDALSQVGLEGFADRDPVTLSGGEKQRLAIAAMLALRPQILVFDEPTTDLDPEGKVQVFEVLASLRSQGVTIVLIEHEISAAERADRLVLMAGGRIVENDHPDRVLPQVDRLERLGVRPGDFERIASALGRPARVATLEAAENLIRPWITPGALPDAAPSHTGEALVAVEDVSHCYDRVEPALAGVTLAIRPGEFVALIGQNGSGKTTLARHMNGLLRPSSGRVLLRGQDVSSLSLHQVAADVGYVFQNPDNQIFAATVRDEVAFGLRNFGLTEDEIEARSHAALDAVGLVGLEDEDPFLFGKGQRQRLAVASLLALEPSLLILDEPTTGLDYLEQRRMMALVRRLHASGMTLVVITHSPWVVAEFATRGVLMQGGRIAFDGPLRELFAQTELLAQCRFRVPDVTRLGQRFGFTPLSVEELLGNAKSKMQNPKCKIV